MSGKIRAGVAIPFPRVVGGAVVVDGSPPPTIITQTCQRESGLHWIGKLKWSYETFAHKALQVFLAARLL